MKNNSMKFMVMILALTSALLGCAQSDNSKSSGDGPTVMVNGEEPTQYFKRFLYRTSGSCEKGMYFHFIKGEVFLPQAADGRIMKLDLNLYLENDGSYIADYIEMIELKDNWGTDSYQVLKETRGSGVWSVNSAGRLVISDLGIGSALIINRVPGAFFAFTHNVGPYVLKGKDMFLRQVMSTGPRNREDDTCR